MCSDIDIWLLFQLFDTNEFICIQTDLEEAKAQELSKLQSSMEALQAKLDEASTRLAKEREVAKTIEEAPPVVKETQVVVQDTEKIDSLTTEVQELKVCSLQQLLSGISNHLLILFQQHETITYHFICCRLHYNQKNKELMI